MKPLFTKKIMLEVSEKAARKVCWLALNTTQLCIFFMETTRVANNFAKRCFETKRGATCHLEHVIQISNDEIKHNGPITQVRSKPYFSETFLFLSFNSLKQAEQKTPIALWSLPIFK